ncbi:MAG: cyclic nucleotide-binding domain-containing protein [Myxococcales bacterium]|nr:cyclic nucleotide-binding domain-containing protein [Myxococcales bacterium]MCB9752637.1 cyclic nucleotide-binding domain-containing protein [Myxococcales bacterium]
MVRVRTSTPASGSTSSKPPPPPVSRAHRQRASVQRPLSPSSSTRGSPILEESLPSNVSPSATLPDAITPSDSLPAIPSPLLRAREASERASAREPASSSGAPRDGRGEERVEERDEADEVEREDDAPSSRRRRSSRASRRAALVAGFHPRIQEMVRAVFAQGGERLRYEGEIARGGTGSIGVVLDRALQRRCAIKLLHDRTYQQPMLVRGFLREAQITGQLAHPNIVPVHELGLDTKHRIYFTMKLIDGRSLAEVIRHPERHDHDRLLNILEILIKVCDALGYAHSRGVLHCDIKSENIMVGDYGQVYLMDWGGARLFEVEGESRMIVHDPLPELPPEETEGLVFGTPGYMSPEQARGRHAEMDQRSDIFALGAILYEVLTGQPPYRGHSNIETLRMAQRCVIPPPEELVSGVMYPRELVRITMKALSRKPAERYGTTDALKQDLQRLIRGGGNFPAITYKQGSHVIREGEVGDAAYIVEVGRLEVYKNVDGERVSLRMLGPGDVFGETAIFAESPRTASVVAVTDTKLIMVTGDVIEREFDAMKPWMGAFIKTLANRFKEAESRRMASASRLAPRSSSTRGARSPFAPPTSSPFHAGEPRSPFAQPTRNPVTSVEIDLGAMDSASVEVDLEDEVEVEVEVEVEDSGRRPNDVLEVEISSAGLKIEPASEPLESDKPWWKR